MHYVAITPTIVWAALILGCLARMLFYRPDGSVLHMAAIALSLCQSLIAFAALAFTNDYAIGGWACFAGFSGTRLLIMVLLAEIGTLVTFLFVAREGTVRLLTEDRGFTAAFVILQLATLGATYRSALLCTV